MAEKLLRINDVLARVPISKSLWWEWVAAGKAPKGIKLSPRVTAWRESDIDAFIEKMAVEA